MMDIGNRRAVPLAIVGIGSIFPQADDAGKFWTNIKNGVDAITEVPESHWRAADYYDSDPKTADKVYAKLGGFLSPVEFNPMDYGILPNAIEAIDTSQLLGLMTVEQALKDAGYDATREFDRDRVSVILGVTGTLELVIPLGARLGFPRWKEALKDAGVDDRLADDVMQRISESYVPWQENSFPGLLGNVVAGRISKHFNLGGTNCVVDAACGSSLSALNLAALELASGRSDMVVTGGIDTFNDIFMYTCFSKTPALSPSGHARPYDAASDGTTLGEGLGILVLKRLADAERDGDKIYAVIKGVGSSSDGRGSAIYEPNANGQAKALRRAYEQAGITPDTIGLIEGHGTGTKVGDAIEVKALHEVFGPADKPWCALGSIKSQIGHTKAAAGSAGLIKAALALHHKVLPPTIKVENPAEILTSETTPFYVNTEPRPWLADPGHPRRAGVSALGFGGSNFHCLLEEYRPEKSQVDWSGDVQIVPFSATDRTALATQLRDFPVTGTWSQLRGDAAQRRAAFDPQASCRLVLVVENGVSDREGQARNALNMLDKKQDESHWETPDGIYFSSGVTIGDVAVLFPGQGAQYTGMLKGLALQFPEFLTTLEEADTVFARTSGLPVGTLAERIYPRPVFNPEDQKQNDTALRATEVAQPALGTVSLAAARVMARFGLTFSAAAGHSYGELTALCAADALDTTSFYRLSRLRGELMAAGSGDRGSMLAVSAPLAEIEKFLADSGLDLVLANRNTPTQGVLSGATSEIEKATGLLAERGLTAKRLDVAAAFHSALVADAAQPFAEALNQVDFHAAKKQVFANTTAQAYPAENDEARQLLARQLASPVDFVNQVEEMYRSGVRTFVEIAPGARLTGMVKAILGERDYQALALDSSNGKRAANVDLARTLAKLAALGQHLDLTRWDDTYVPPVLDNKKKPGISIQLSGANHFKRPAKRPPLDITPAQVAVPVTQEKPMAKQEQPPQAPVTQTQTAAPSEALQDALRITQQSIQALQNLQEQTAKLHQQFLEGQQAATQSFMTLVQQQQQLVSGTGAPVASPQAFVAPPVSASSTPIQPVAQPETVQATPQVAVQRVQEPVDSPSSQASAAAQAPSSTVDSAPVLFEIIAEKTGYPVEMLELDMALDSDLGIDSIKRVEILSALQEKLPGAPAIRPEDLGTLQTLGQIVNHLNQGLSAAGAVAVTAGSATVAVDSIKEILLAIIAEKTGYPVEMLELDMALDSDLGIDSIKRVEILSALQERLPGAPAIRPEDLGTLQTLGQIVDHLNKGQQRIPTVQSTPQVSGIDKDKVSTTLLAVIAEKTGYPVEMLELDMALDSDLGIDSIKRVEILSALQEKLPEAPAVKPEDLGVLQTLGQIIDHLCQGTQPQLQKIPTVLPTPQLGQLDREEVATTLLAVIADKTGYPVEMLELGMALDSDLGIDSIKRVEILSVLQQKLPGAPAIKPEHLGTLQTVAQIVDFLATGPATSPQPTSEEQSETEVLKSLTRQTLKVVSLPKKRPLAGMKFAPGAEVWITDDGSTLADEICRQMTARHLIPRKVTLGTDTLPEIGDNLCGLVIVAPLKGCDDRFFTNAFALLRQVGAGLNASAAHGGAFLATISRLNGTFGLETQSRPLKDALSGGLAGLCKTAAREWPTVQCKALDIAMGMEILPTAAAIADEIFTRSPLEVGITSTGLHALELINTPLEAEGLQPPIGEGDLVIISGGARGVTAEVAVSLASETRATLLLLGRSQLPEEEPEWLRKLKTEAEIKKALIEHSESALKPLEVAQAYQRISAEREIRSAMDRILNVGGRPLYRSVDLRDNAAVAAVVDEVRSQYGPVRGLIHGAGVLADKLILEKTDAQFTDVYSTKVAGLRALLAAIGEDDVKFVALFSSSTGRFGRIGQSDYAVANEILNKTAQQLAADRPVCRVVSLNWGPWDGGMVTPALKKIFADEGIDVIDLKAGADYLVHEISTPVAGPVELVILGGEAEEQRQPEPEPQQNIHVSKAFDLELSVAQFPFLKSHVMDGKAVLPMAVIIEWLAHGAMHNNPGLRFQGLNDLRILKGVILNAEQTLELQVMTGKAIKSDGVHVVPVELSSVTADGARTVHARSRVVLATRLPEAKAPQTPLPLPPYPYDDQDTYRMDRLFHGETFHGIRELIGCSNDGISARVNPAPAPSAWIDQPLRNSWFSDPLALDSSFQMLILWSFERYQAGSLPVFTERYRQFVDRFPEKGVEIRARIIEQNAHRACADIDFVDTASGQLVARIENYECVIDASLNASFRRNKLIGVA
ncbi:MAG: beta-ketoacyl synthase [Desulfuromonas sp.]|nr:MAG: beta-ketoacyl synthase [Desulfuromonas sp.]